MSERFKDGLTPRSEEPPGPDPAEGPPAENPPEQSASQPESEQDGKPDKTISRRGFLGAAAAIGASALLPENKAQAEGIYTNLIDADFLQERLRDSTGVSKPLVEYIVRYAEEINNHVRVIAEEHPEEPGVAREKQRFVVSQFIKFRDTLSSGKTKGDVYVNSPDSNRTFYRSLGSLLTHEGQGKERIERNIVEWAEERESSRLAAFIDHGTGLDVAQAYKKRTPGEVGAALVTAYTRGIERINRQLDDETEILNFARRCYRHLQDEGIKSVTLRKIESATVRNLKETKEIYEKFLEK